LRLHQGREAVEEFEKFAKVGHSMLSGPLLFLAQLGVARGHAMAGSPDKARIAYRNFLTTWKDADPDIPVLRQAREESARQ
jgi:hypothetical protein